MSVFGSINTGYSLVQVVCKEETKIPIANSLSQSATCSENILNEIDAIFSSLVLQPKSSNGAKTSSSVSVSRRRSRSIEEVGGNHQKRVRTEKYQEPLGEIPLKPFEIDAIFSSLVLQPKSSDGAETSNSVSVSRSHSRSIEEAGGNHQKRARTEKYQELSGEITLKSLQEGSLKQESIKEALPTLETLENPAHSTSSEEKLEEVQQSSEISETSNSISISRRRLRSLEEMYGKHQKRARTEKYQEPSGEITLKCLQEGSLKQEDIKEGLPALETFTSENLAHSRSSEEKLEEVQKSSEVSETSNSVSISRRRLRSIEEVGGKHQKRARTEKYQEPSGEIILKFFQESVYNSP